MSAKKTTVETQWAEGVLPLFERLNLEPDQRLRRALENLPRLQGVTDGHLLVELLRLNISATRHIEVERLADLSTQLLLSPVKAERPIPGSYLAEVLTVAIENRRDQHTVGVGDLFNVWRAAERDSYLARPYALDLLAFAVGGSKQTPFSDLPAAQKLFNELDRAVSTAEDFSFVLAAESDRLVFRVTSVLDDYVQSEAGVLLPQRAILTHFRDHFGGFTEDEIAELESLLNNSKAKETQFQKFFERHPHFFRKWDHREVYSHVYLRRPSRDPLIPDFLLCDRELQKAAIVELKLPTPKVVRRQDNRTRFTAAISEARAQLLEYRDWFRDANNRRRLKNRVGMEIYEPDLVVVIGRSAEFRDEVDRQKLAATHPDIELVTYDDIVKFARRRKILISSST